MLNNRELASLIWLSVGLLWVLTQGAVRNSLGGVVRAMLRPQVVLPMIAFAAYMVGVVALAGQVRLWHPPLAKDIVIWFIVVGLALLVNFSKASEDASFFRRTVLATVGLSAALEFYTNLVVFALPVELFLQPTLVFLVLMSTVAGLKAEHKAVKSVVDGALALAGIVLVIAISVQLVREWATLEKAEIALSLALPVWLTLGAIPFIYLFSLFANYELALMRVGSATDDRTARRRAKFALMTGFHLRNRDLHRFVGGWPHRLAEAGSLAEARRVIAEHRASLREAEAASRREANDLRRYAGVEGTDANGRQLDRREFQETKRALRWLGTCQMGWHRNRGGRYDENLLRIVGDLTSQGLPTEHGIQMSVREDGQAWFAWRRSVTGWCFAIGAAGPPPSEWEYEGPDPPAGFPGMDSSWVLSSKWVN